MNCTPLRAGPNAPSFRLAPWHDAQLALYPASPCAACAVVKVGALRGVAAAGACCAPGATCMAVTSAVIPRKETANTRISAEGSTIGDLGSGIWDLGLVGPGL